MAASLHSYLQKTKQIVVKLHSNSHSTLVKCWVKKHLTLCVDNLIDFVWVIWILGVILNHLEVREVVQSTAEVGFPSGLVFRELVDFTTCNCPCLCRIQIRLNIFTPRI